MSDVELLVDGLDFGEGPRWRDGCLWYSDFFQHRVYRVQLDGTRETVLDLGDEQPSGLGWLPSGELLVVGMLKRQLLRYDGTGVKVHADLAHIATSHCNDMVVDSRGHAYVGNFGFDYGAGEEAVGASLALVRPDGTALSVAEDLQFPNGSVITSDESTLIVGETFGSRYSAFTIAPDGTLSNRRIWAEIPGRLPDGCCLDSSGAIWFADAIRPEAVRVTEGGGITEVVEVPERAFACMLGGETGRTLFVLTAPSDPAGGLEPGRGAIWMAEAPAERAGMP
ncbi:MAG: SMP-30/gluconolactonase/LRE family protein [Actinomycetota bacterium]|nr:SMP-30/gluconolactonase/LRE family protein [Actinomycetota bacterium]